MKLYKIRPYLYQRGRFHKWDRTYKLKILRTHRIRTVVNLTSIVDADLLSVGWLTYIHLPIPDGPTANLVLVKKVVERVVNSLSKDCALLVHCNAGRNRSSLFSALVLMEIEGLTGEQAIRAVRAVRQNALSTLAFCKYLLEEA